MIKIMMVVISSSSASRLSQSLKQISCSQAQFHLSGLYYDFDEDDDDDDYDDDDDDDGDNDANDD